MNRTAKFAAATTAGLLAIWAAWGLYNKRAADRIPYTIRSTVDGVELREYPEVIVAETRAPNENVAFRRLFEYISGENEGASKISMTAPVRTHGGKISMTAPVRTVTDEAQVTMGFFLPREYTPAAVPKPTNPTVSLVVEVPRTLAVRSFGWYATDDRIEREKRALLRTLTDNEIIVKGDPYVLQYDAPWTPPFMRRNEVAVEIAP
ncbi:MULTISPECIES: heme-binding protein [unclassified Haladaptatus]|uniref:SOUL family heme-binding protein n=1 Tax=unclassified Haladaptatus TaxID=2622732 RepID=UPI0023E7E8D1|nr:MULTISPECIES: heme-binding protein [unclassified Haladaptatus]